MNAKASLVNRRRPRAAWGMATALAATVYAAPAAAQAPPACPPGALCQDQRLPQPAGQPAAPAGQPRRAGQPPGQPPARRAPAGQPPAAGQPRGQVIIVQPGSAPPRAPGYGPGAPPPPRNRMAPRRRRRNRHRSFGVAVRGPAALMPRFKDEAEDIGMGGVGAEFKYRPLPAFALGVSLDFVSGVDSNGYDREEVPIALSAYIYPNPQHMVQFYGFGGVGWSFARVFSDTFQQHLAGGTSDEYTYFGGHLGAGVEFRVIPLLGINVDGVGMLRTRTDDDGGKQFPEFFDPVAREGANASAAGLVRAGVTFWF